MKPDDVILGIPEILDEQDGRFLRIRQMAAGPSVRFAIACAEWKKKSSEMLSLLGQADDLLQNLNDASLVQLRQIAEQVEQLDEGKLEILKVILKNADITPPDDEWLKTHFPLSKFQAYIVVQNLLNALGLQLKNQNTLPAIQALLPGGESVGS